MARKPRRKMRRRKRNTLSVIPFNRLPFPKTLITKMRFIQSGQLNATTTQIDAALFSTNGAYNPSRGGATSNQPFGWDQYQALYTDYVVLGSRCTVEFFNVVNGGTLGEYCGVGIAVVQGSGPLSATELANQYLDMQQSTVKSTLTPERSVVKLSKNFSTKKWFGLQSAKDWTDDQPAATQNPVNQASYAVYQSPIRSVDNPDPIEYRVFIDYIVMFKNPKSYAASVV